MSRTLRSGAPHRRSGLALAATAAMALVLGVMATPASATISISSIGPTTSLVDEMSVTVSGTASPGAWVTVAQCLRAATPADFGLDCNNTDTDRYDQGFAHATTGAFSFTIVVDDDFDSHSFNPQEDPTQAGVTCEDVGGDECVVAVAEYSGMAPSHVVETTITFL